MDVFVPVVILIVAVFLRKPSGVKIAFANDDCGYLRGRSREYTGIVRPQKCMLLYTTKTLSTAQNSPIPEISINESYALCSSVLSIRVILVAYKGYFCGIAGGASDNAHWTVYSE